VATFEAASIKPSTADPGSGSEVTSETGRIIARNVTLKRCVRGAYDVPEAQVFGGPKWVDEDRYDINAKAAGPAGGRELSAMFQSLLAERFHLVLHRETRALPGYALVLGKGGLRAMPSAPGTPWNSTSSRRSIEAEGCNMAGLAQKLSEVLHVPVADMTTVDGKFDFKLEWTPEDLQAKPPSGTAMTEVALGPSIFTALREQLGLRLEARKVPTEVLVIDRAEKASEN